MWDTDLGLGPLEIFAGVQEVAGVEGAFDLGVEMTEGGSGGYCPPRFFGEADSVLTTDDSAHGEDSLEKFVEDAVHPAIVRFGFNRGHQVDVNIAVSRMTETGNGNAVLLLEIGG